MADWDLTKIVETQRDVTAGYHLVVGRGWRLLGEGRFLHSPLAYGAFEYRCCIERVLVELLAIMNAGNLNHRQLAALRTVTALRKAIYSSAGGPERFRRRMRAHQIWAQEGGAPRGTHIALVDVEKLHVFWRSLSEYCHRQLRPKETWASKGESWIQLGYKLLNEVEDYMWEIEIQGHIGWVRLEEQEVEAREAVLDFVEGRSNETEFRLRLRIMAPILERRRKGRIGG